jgi:hypothetical protein
MIYARHPSRWGGSRMRDRHQSILFFAVLIASLAAFSSLGAAGENKDGLTAQDEDAFILYKYSLIDAKNDRSSKITESTDGFLIHFLLLVGYVQCLARIPHSITFDRLGQNNGGLTGMLSGSGISGINLV